MIRLVKRQKKQRSAIVCYDFAFLEDKEKIKKTKEFSSQRNQSSVKYFVFCRPIKSLIILFIDWTEVEFSQGGFFALVYNS